MDFGIWIWLLFFLHPVLGNSVTKGKSVKKCQEYSAYVNVTDYGAALSSRSMIAHTIECPIAAVSLVVGGVNAKPKEFPHMVAIGYGKELRKVQYLCGGSLISLRHVLSAAHCENHPELGKAAYARLGGIDLLENDIEVQNIYISKRTVHPMYAPPLKYNDIAIFELEKPVEVDSYARPACLHVEPEITQKSVYATGWGKLEFRRTSGHNILQMVKLNIIDFETCTKIFGADDDSRQLQKGIQPSMICAGVLEGGKDTCQGDSGGPLQIVLETPHCMYSIIGVTSYGKGCGFKNSPAIYTRVSHYISWIESIVWPSE